MLDSIVERDRTVDLRKVANLSAGGVSIDATTIIHHHNIILVQDIAQFTSLVWRLISLLKIFPNLRDLVTLLSYFRN
jgi:cyanophycin synthetase